VAFSVASGAECNQILRRIPAKLAPALYVVNLQVVHCGAVLAPPIIPFQHFVSDQGVFFWIQFEPRLLAAYTH
jgi:hypothetical protein